MNLVVWGARGHALVLAELTAQRDHRVALIVDNDPRAVAPLPDVPLAMGYIGLDAWLATWKGALAFAVAIGGARGADRMSIHGQLIERGLSPVNLVHSAAYVATTATIGEGAQILAGAVVGAAATVGTQCIVNTSASVDHECVLGDGSHIGPGATLAGYVTVGRNAFVGAGATVLPNRQIGEGSVVGAGAVVTHDVTPGATVVGVPARPLTG